MFELEVDVQPAATIKVIGVGGAGGNAALPRRLRGAGRTAGPRAVPLRVPYPAIGRDARDFPRLHPGDGDRRKRSGTRVVAGRPGVDPRGM